MYKILKNQTFEMKFHFINKEDGSSASEQAMEQLAECFAKYGSVRLYKGVIIFTSTRTFLDAGSRDQEALDFAENLEKAVQSAANEMAAFELVSLD